MLSPESPDGTTSKVSCEFSTFHPSKAWYPPPTGDRPPKFTLRVITITNTWLLQRLVKQKTTENAGNASYDREHRLRPNAMMEMRKNNEQEILICVECVIVFAAWFYFLSLDIVSIFQKNFRGNRRR